MAHRSLQLARVSAWGLLAAITFFTLGPLNDRPHLTEDPQTERALAYFTLGYAFALAYPRSRIAVGAGVVLGAVALETSQLLTIDRHAHVRDAVAKSVGGLVGVVAVVVSQRFADTRAARESLASRTGRSPAA